MNDTTHEPELISDAKNSIAYFIVLGILTLGLVFIFSGMVSPIFWKQFQKYCVEMSKEDEEKGKGTFEANLKENLRMAKIILTIWFILSWGFIVVAYWHGI